MKEGGRKQGSASPCAACKLLRRRCAADCVFAPYFPADEPHKFANVHKVFGASNVNKMLQGIGRLSLIRRYNTSNDLYELPEHQRGDAVSSMVYEANARVRDPVYGCVGAISSLQQQIDALQIQLAVAQAEAVHLRVRQTQTASCSYWTQPHSPTNSASPSSKPIFDIDMGLDHTSYADSMWS
ncbi:LOB domain-containing protein 4-like isoform X1 [Arachis duranensis]|uniref:LOB domain-containing protein 4-like isoform X1 n=1 Tax=Arachis duranensis TaxID=130453 RepID=A0A6P5NHI1_ARADU|nr:LOB domain-containing protein 4-like isoform X1 [Arachis duranensis]